MNPFSGDHQKSWWAVGVVSAVLFGGILLLLSYRGSDSSGGEVSRPAEVNKIGLTRLAKHTEGRIVAEEAQFFDPTPLFLPTEWNADQKPLPTSVLNDPGRMFAEYPSKLQFAEEGVALKFEGAGQLPGSSSDTLDVLGGEMPFQGIGQASDVVVGLPARGSYLLVQSVNEEKGAIMAQNLPEAVPPEDNWRPMEFMAVVNRAGLVGSLSLIERSGHESVDRYFRNYLVQTFRLGEYLPPGFYRISVGP